MASPSLSAFVFKSCADAIEKYKEGAEDPDKLLRLSAWLTSFRGTGAITDAQIDALADMLGVEVEVPDAPDTYEDALADLSATVSEQGEEMAGQGDAIAELSEIVSGLVPAEEE